MVSEVSGADSAHWAEIEALFQALAETEPSLRAQRLNALAAGHSPEAVSEVRGLLGSLERHEHLFDAPAAEQVSLEREYAQGARLGRWEVTGTLGRGGQGLILQVTRSEGGFRQRGVLKTLRQSSASPDALRRLLRERQLLAELDHPGLPAVLDGGLLDDGAPFFVLDFIAGEAIDAHARRRGLKASERVGLLRQVAAVVAHAHSRLVLHRDLKPANVLVEPTGRVVLLDFGVAQPLDAERTHTVAGFTPAFAAPEQVRGERSTAATDVYGLGATGFALLCGRAPFADVEAGGLDALLNLAPAFPAAMDPDLAAILAKALRKEPESRYPSIEAFDADLARWERGEAVLARAGGRRYRAGKWLRRHRGAVLAGLALGVSLSGGLALSLQQRDQARQAQHRAETTLELLVDLFAGATRDTAAGETAVRRLELGDGSGLEASVRSVLDRASEDGLDEVDAEIRLPLHRAFGDVYASLGARDSAIAQYRAALELDPASSEAGIGLAHVLLQNADKVPPEAFERLAALLQRPLPRVTKLRLIDRGCDALRRMGRLDEAEALLSQGFALYGLDPQAAAASIAPSGDESVWQSFLYLQRSRLALARGELASARRDLDASLAFQEAGNGTSHISLVRVLQTRADLHQANDDAALALADVERAQAIIERRRPDDHAAHGRLLTQRGILLRKLGDFQEADAAYAAALDRYARVQGRDTAAIRLQIERNRTNLDMDAARFARAAERYALLLDESRAALGATHRMTIENQLSLARAQFGSADVQASHQGFLSLLALGEALPTGLRRATVCGAMRSAIALRDIALALELLDRCDQLQADDASGLDLAEQALARSLLRHAQGLAPDQQDLQLLHNTSALGIPVTRRLWLSSSQIALVCPDCASAPDPD
jgi:tetratricopeptide (TPR) repeat protein